MTKQKKLEIIQDNIERSQSAINGFFKLLKVQGDLKLETSEQFIKNVYLLEKCLNINLVENQFLAELLSLKEQIENNTFNRMSIPTFVQGHKNSISMIESQSAHHQAVLDTLKSNLDVSEIQTLQVEKVIEFNLLKIKSHYQIIEQYSKLYLNISSELN